MLKPIVHHIVVIKIVIQAYGCELSHNIGWSIPADMSTLLTNPPLPFEQP